jgi:broad specificity phosphatase PhoE
MLEFLLIRPGATDYDQQGRIQGTLDIPLNDDGQLQAAGLIEALRGRGLSVIYSAACLPALETAETIASGLSLKCKRLDALTNLDHGLWQGMMVDEVKHKHPKVYRQWQESPQSVRPPQGELLSDVRERVEAALTRLLKKHPDGVVGLVAPEPLASLVRCCLQGQEPTNLWKNGHGGSWELIKVETRAPAGAR